MLHRGCGQALWTCGDARNGLPRILQAICLGSGPVDLGRIFGLLIAGVSSLVLPGALSRDYLRDDDLSCESCNQRWSRLRSVPESAAAGPHRRGIRRQLATRSTALRWSRNVRESGAS